MKSSKRNLREPPPALDHEPIRRLFSEAALKMPNTDIEVRTIQAYTHNTETATRDIYRVALAIGNCPFGVTIEVTNNIKERYKLWAVSGPDPLRKRTRNITNERCHATLDSNTTAELISTLFAAAKTQEGFVQMAVREKNSQILKVGAIALAFVASLAAITIANEGTSRAALRQSAAALTANFNTPPTPKSQTGHAGIER